MFKKHFILSGILTMMFSTMQAQIPDDFIRVDADMVKELDISRERTYTKESLFGYMNGGAELYLDYGFDRLVVSDLVFKGNDIKVEAYQMPSVDKAFGIYSVNIFRCSKADALTEHYCQSDYQIQFCIGNYYVNIINISGSSEGLAVASLIAEQLMGLIEGESFSVSSYLPDNFRPGKIEKLLLISGDVALGNHAYAYSQYLEGYSGYNALIVEGDINALLIIRFETGEQLEKFRNSMGIDQFPVCGEKVSLNEIAISLTNIGDIILHIDSK